MRKSIFLISALFAISLGAYAQNDDMYFTPTKTPKVKKEQLLKVQEGIYEKSDDDVYSAEDYNNKNYSEAEVDAYNRRGYKVGKDTLYIGDGDKEANEYADRYADEYNSNDYYYSNRLARFHEPVVNIYFGYGVPYYWGWDYGWYDWGYNYSWNWGWNWNWYPGYYGWYGGWGWSYPWHYHYGWYDWGWHRPYVPARPWRGSSWNGGRYIAGQTHSDKIGSAGGRIWSGGRNYRDAIERNGSTRSYSTNSRAYGNNDRSYSTGRSNMSTRSFGTTRPSSSSNMGTRSMGSGSSNIGSSSRSFGSGSGSSMGTRSFGGGSGRSMGGGGGRSFGGGRR